MVDTYLPYPGPERRVYNGPSDASLTRVANLLEQIAAIRSYSGISMEDAETLRAITETLRNELESPYVWQDRYLEVS